MDCPNCGINIEELQKELETAKKEKQRRDKFEHIYAGHLGPVRRKKWFLNFLKMAVFMTIFLAFVGALIISDLFQDVKTLHSYTGLFLLATAFLGLTFALLISDPVHLTKTEQEEELWRGYCQDNPIL